MFASKKECRGKKSIHHHHHHRGTFFLGLSPDPEVTEQKKLRCTQFSWAGKRVFTIGPTKKGTHHRASDPEKEKKEGFHGGGVHFFLPWNGECARIWDCCATICVWGLEAHQRYFSYRAMLVAIVSQNYLVLVLWGIAQISRNMLQNGVSRRCACVKISTKGGGFAPFWGAANLSEKVSRDMGYRSDSIAISRDMGPLRFGAPCRP